MSRFASHVFFDFAHPLPDVYTGLNEALLVQIFGDSVLLADGSECRASHAWADRHFDGPASVVYSEGNSVTPHAAPRNSRWHFGSYLGVLKHNVSICGGDAMFQRLFISRANLLRVWGPTNTLAFVGDDALHRQAWQLVNFVKSTHRIALLNHSSDTILRDLCALQPRAVVMSYHLPHDGGLALVLEMGSSITKCSPLTNLIWQTNLPTLQNMRSLIISDRRLLHGLRASPFAQRWRVLDAAAYALAAPQDVFDPTNDYLSEAVMDMTMGINEALLVYIFGDSVLDKCPGEGNTSLVSRALDAPDGICAYRFC